ncbi:MAG: septation protein SpoVG family protein [Patescibacteria group bacterium]
MEISNIRIHLITKPTRDNCIAYASFAINGGNIQIGITGIRIIKIGNKLYLAMPQRIDSRGLNRDILFPNNKQTKEVLEKAIFKAYDNAVNSENINKPPNILTPKKSSAQESINYLNKHPNK